jgi:hypothetical protein
MARPSLTVEEALRDERRLFLDTAPIIYFAERSPAYIAIVRAIFAAVDAGTPVAVTSPISLAECLVLPYRSGLVALQHTFIDLIVSGPNTEFVGIGQAVAERAADVRARYNLKLPDALRQPWPRNRDVTPSLPTTMRSGASSSCPRSWWTSWWSSSGRNFPTPAVFLMVRAARSAGGRGRRGGG